MSNKLPKRTQEEIDELAKDLAFNMVYHGDLKLRDLPQEIHCEYNEIFLKGDRTNDSISCTLRDS